MNLISQGTPYVIVKPNKKDCVTMIEDKNRRSNHMNWFEINYIVRKSKTIL